MTIVPIESVGAVLVVGSNPALRDRLQRAGHEVAECAGPGESGHCPLVDSGRCPLVEHADGIVFDLDLTDPRHREILAGYRRRPATGPIAVLTDDADGGRLDGLEGVRVEPRIPGEAAVRRFSGDVQFAAAARWALADLSGSLRRM